MRYSPQREAVYQVLYSTKTHPDVSWIYNKVKSIIPSIGLGTVYRNLAELEKLGRIKKVSVEGSIERYDANVAPHAHFVCTCCGNIYDVENNSVTVLCTLPNVERYETTLYGECQACQANK